MSLEHDPLNIIITGVGGQGNVLASQVVGEALLGAGCVVTIGETYGVAQRGGTVASHVRVSRQRRPAPLVPAGRCHLVVGLEPVETLRALATFGNPDVLVLTNTRPVHPLDVLAGTADYPPLERVFEELEALSSRLWTVDATDIALKLDSAIVANMVMVGALAGTGLLPLERPLFEEAIGRHVPSDRVALNLAAYDRGADAVRA